MILLPDRYETYENTKFWHLDVTKHCVFTSFVVTICQKPCFSLVFAAFSHGFLGMSLVFFVFFAFFAFFAFSPARSWRREGWRSATARASENAKKAKKAKKTKKTNDILRKPCEKAAKPKENQCFCHLIATKPVKTQGLGTSTSRNTVFSQVSWSPAVRNLAFL